MPHESDAAAEARERENVRVEGLTNAIYATILLVAGLGAFEGLVDSAGELLIEGLAAVLVLFIAHLYASWLAAEATHDSALSHRRVISVVKAQSTLIAVFVVPAVILAISAAGAFSASVAIALSIAYGIGLLFVVSAALAIHHGRKLAIAVLYGASGAALGGLVVAPELSLH